MMSSCIKVIYVLQGKDGANNKIDFKSANQKCECKLWEWVVGSKNTNNSPVMSMFPCHVHYTENNPISGYVCAIKVEKGRKWSLLIKPRHVWFLLRSLRAVLF